MANKIKNTIINPNKAIASVKANPNNAYVNNLFSIFGFFDKAVKNPEKKSYNPNTKTCNLK